MRIITISREFGSGGRELGKRLAGLLGIDYYDREIITAIARRYGLDEGYVETAVLIISPSIRRGGIWKNWHRRWQDLSCAGMGGNYAYSAFGSF